MSSTEQPHDLNWLAYCYLQGELDSAASADFESRLGEDPAARDALVAAARLEDCLTAAVPAAGVRVLNDSRPDASARSNPHTGRWLALVAALSLLLASGLTRWQTDDDAEDGSQLAQFWVEAASTDWEVDRDIEQSELAEVTPDSPTVAATDDAEGDGETLEASVSWMAAALAEIDRRAEGAETGEPDA